MPVMRFTSGMLVLPPMRDDLAPVRECGYHGFQRAIASRRRCSPNWHVVLQVRRTAEWVVEGGPRLRVRANELALIPPRTPFQGGGAYDEPNCHFWLELDLQHHGAIINASELAVLRQACLARGCATRTMTPGLIQACRGLHHILAKGVAAPLGRVELRAWLALVLAGLADSVTASDGDVVPAGVARALARIDQGIALGMRVPVTALAQCARVDPTAFTRMFTRAIGRTPADHVARTRTAAALRLIADGRTVTEAATTVGMPSSQHLATCCRRYFGRTPTALAAALRSGCWSP